MPSLTVLVSQARQGYADAIATLLNRHLEPHGITSRAVLRQGCLKILLESAQPLGQSHALLSFIYRGLQRLKPESVHQVHIYARLTGQPAPLWVKSFGLNRCEAVQPAHQSMVDPTPTPKRARALSWFETQSPPLILLWLLVFYPVGFYSLWRHLRWPRLAKGAIAGLTLVVVAGYWLWRLPLLSPANVPAISAFFISPVSTASIDSYTHHLRSLDPYGELIIDVSSGSRVGEVTVRVTPTWEAQPHSARLKNANTLWALWANLYAPAAPETAYIQITNKNGDTIGGSTWKGSLVEVQPD